MSGGKRFRPSQAIRIMERVLFEMEKKMNGNEITEYLRKIADKVESGESISLNSGDQSVELDTDRPAEFEVKVEEEDNEESLELEIEWKKKSKNNESLSIE